MAGSYRIIGAEMSPYSVKIRSYFRYKAIPHQWILRNAASGMLRAKYAAVADKAALDPVLEAAGCLAGLRA
jgi:hypothetical protein